MDPYFTAGFERSLVPQTILDAQARYIRVNDAFCALVGRSREELLGITPLDLTHPSDSGAAQRSLEELLAGKRVAVSAERVISAPDGQPIPVLVHQAAVLDDDGRVIGGYGSFQDLRVLMESELRLEQQRQFHEALTQRAHEAALVADANARILYASPSVKSLFGYDADEVLTLEGWDFVHPDDAPSLRTVFERVVRDGGTASVTFRVRHRDGSWRCVEETLANLLSTHVGGVVCNLTDVTERREAERRLELAEARNQAIVETVQEGIWVIRNTGQIEYVNEQMGSILGLPLDLIYEGGLTAVIDESRAEEVWHRLRTRQARGPETYEFTYSHPDGSQRILLIAASPLTYGDGEFVGSLATIADVTETRRVEEELRRAALQDPLTGIPNRALLSDRLEQMVRRQSRDGAEFAVLSIDLDHFKLVNDTRGHDIGDEVLVQVAHRLTAAASADETVARLGGDTFVVLAEVTPGRPAADVAEHLLQLMREPYVLGESTVHLSASIGVATVPPHPPQDVMRFAEAAMFAAKTTGRDRVRMFDDTLAQEAEQTYSLIAELRAALADDGLDMHYQPIISLAGGAVLGYEALARWNRRDGEEIAPGVFVPIAERAGAARDLDRWAIQRAITDMARLRAASEVPHDAYVSINLSAQHLADPALVALLVDVAARSEFPAHQIQLEITERSVVGDATATIEVLRGLHTRGFKISIDDFGTGYSSMTYLRNFPVTSLKIDRLFVTDLGTDPDALAIVTSIIQLARAVGVDVVAEGIETVEQAVQLRQLGCTAGQGWLWSKALPPVDLGVTHRLYPIPTGAGPRSRRQPSALAEVREEHGLVRLLELQRQGASLTTIAAALNAEGFRAPNGQRWHKMTVARALSYLAPENAQLS